MKNIFKGQAPMFQNGPIKRSKIRLFIGKKLFTYKRYLNWYLSDQKFAKTKAMYQLPIQVFEHQSPLFRQLQNVDMWMQRNKVTNLKIAISHMNGLILQPGETFSYWKLIGKPTKRQGYQDGMVLFSGSFKAGVGGGLCQLSNLIYWMTLHTPLTVTERFRHSYDVFPDANRTQPFGSGATCVYNYRDLQICNHTDQPYQLDLKLTEDLLIGQWRTMEQQTHVYKVYEKNHHITHEVFGGYMRRNELWRRVYQSETLIRDEFIAKNDALMLYQPFLTV